MLLDLRAERRPGLLGRSDTLALLEIYVEKAVKQLHIAVPIVTGPEGMGRTAVLHELIERSRNTGRTGGYGCVRSGLGQALIDATTSLAVSIKSLHPDLDCTRDLIAAAEAFRDRSPDEATEDGFVGAIDHLLYALSTALPEIPRGYVLCIDDLQIANDGRVRAFLEGLIALSSTGAPIPVVLTSSVGLGIRSIPQGLDQLQLRPLTNADLADIAQRQGVTATPEVIRQIGDYVEGRPGRAIEIIERAAAKGLVDAHTVRAVIAESKILGAERSAAADAERLAAQARTAPDRAHDHDASTVVAASSELAETHEVAPVAPAAGAGPSARKSRFDRSLGHRTGDHEVTRSQVELDGLDSYEPPVSDLGPAPEATSPASDPTVGSADAIDEANNEDLAAVPARLAAPEVAAASYLWQSELPHPVMFVDPGPARLVRDERTAAPTKERNHELRTSALAPEDTVVAGEQVRASDIDAAEHVDHGVLQDQHESPQATPETTLEASTLTDHTAGAPESPVAADEDRLSLDSVPSAPLPVRQAGSTRFGAFEPKRNAELPQTPPVTLTPTQRRVLSSVASADPVRGSVSVALVKRTLGEVSRFGGAASPVADAITVLVAHGLLERSGDTVTLTAAGAARVAPGSAR